MNIFLTIISIIPLIILALLVVAIVTALVLKVIHELKRDEASRFGLAVVLGVMCFMLLLGEGINYLRTVGIL